jgi:hypothetical protein
MSEDGIAFLATFAPSRFNLFGSGLTRLKPPE